jgi:dipeptidyl aminopeptidase/acylaminoacyl peptidase
MSSNSGHINSARRAGVALLVGIVLTLALNACGGGGTLIPGQSPTASSTVNATATPTPKPASAFAYAFARDGQVWVAQAGKEPQQLSHLAANGQKINSLAWSPDSKHLAFEVAGAGSPVDYVIDATSGTIAALNVPSTTAAATLGWIDNKTVIAVKTVDTHTQFWKTDITNNSASQVTTADGVTQVKILNQAIYYSAVDTSSNQLMLHRYDVNLGSEGTPAPIAPAGTSTLKVNWDISSDGSHVLTGFRLATPDASWDNGFWSVSFASSSDRSPVFTDDEIPFANFKDTDTVTMSFSPDGQTAFITTNSGSVGPTSENLDGTNFTTYTPKVGITSPGNISWAPNGSSFALTDPTTNEVTIYTLASKTAGATFASKASLLQWAPKS